MGDDNKIVSLVEYRAPGRPEKANPAIPDRIWDRFQDLGEVATEHLARLLSDPRFAHFSIKDQMRIIETTFQRAYGSPDGAVRKNLHVHMNPEDDKGFNALRELSHRASRRLPEYKTPPHRGDEELEDMNAGGKTIDHEPLNRDPGVDVPGDGN